MNILCLSSFDEVKLGKSLQSSYFNVKVLTMSGPNLHVMLCYYYDNHSSVFSEEHKMKLR